MLIVCPACAAAYDVPESRLAPGRVVRCARCGTDWVPVAPAAASEPAPDLPPEPEPSSPEPAPQPSPESAPGPAPNSARDAVRFPPPSLAAAPRSPLLRATVAPAPARGQAALTAAWVLTVVILVLAAWGAYANRDRVMRAWPPSERVYTALGLAPR